MKILKKCQLADLVHLCYCYSLHSMIFTVNNFCCLKEEWVKKLSAQVSSTLGIPLICHLWLGCMGWMPWCGVLFRGQGVAKAGPFPNRPLLPREGASIQALMLQRTDTRLGWLKSLGFSCSASCSIARLIFTEMWHRGWQGDPGIATSPWGCLSSSPLSTFWQLGFRVESSKRGK